jgi:type 1 fimbria pilin
MKIRRWAATGLCVAATLGAWAAPGVSADTNPITVTLTVTPATASVGDQVQVVATLTNNTSTTTSAALGIENPQYANEKITAVGGAGCQRRNLIKLIYCGNSQLGAGATASITVTLTPIATGTDNFTAYGRITNVADVDKYATLTVS